MTEIWKDIAGYEGKYQVSNLGRVKSLNYRRTGKERCLEPKDNNDGYLQVTLYKNGGKDQPLVHRLVAMAFILNPEGKPEVDHINRDTTDNRVENLRWVTSIENKNNGLSKPVLCVETGTEYHSVMEAERLIGVKHPNITNCCNGRYGYKTAGGYHWRYAD